jgi:drug/metabolite transporter (DMT)-like permease
MKRFTGVALVVVSSIAYGAMPIFARLAYADGTAPTTVLFLRFTLAALILLVYMVASGTSFPRGKTLVQLILMGVIGYVGQSLAYFLAISLAPASLVALLLYLSPVLVTVGAFVFLHEKITWLKIAALGLALAGAVLTISANGGLASLQARGILPGVLLGLLAAVIGAVYVLVGSNVLRAAPAIPATTIVITSTAAAYTVIGAVQGFTFPSTWNGYAAILALATISTVFAIGTFMAGLQRVGPANASTLGVLEPASAVALAALILGETLVPGQIIGGVMIAVAVVLVSRTV